MEITRPLNHDSLHVDGHCLVHPLPAAGIKFPERAFAMVKDVGSFMNRIGDCPLGFACDRRLVVSAWQTDERHVVIRPSEGNQSIHELGGVKYVYHCLPTGSDDWSL